MTGSIIVMLADHMIIKGNTMDLIVDLIMSQDIMSVIGSHSTSQYLYGLKFSITP